MLILTRRTGDTLIIEPHPDAVGSDPANWFARPIEVRILRIEGKHVRIGVEAAEGLLDSRFRGNDGISELMWHRQ